MNSQSKREIVRQRMAEIIIKARSDTGITVGTVATAIANVYADQLLAIEVPDITACSTRATCKYNRQPTPDDCRGCDWNRPATLGDLIPEGE